MRPQRDKGAPKGAPAILTAYPTAKKGDRHGPGY